MLGRCLRAAGARRLFDSLLAVFPNLLEGLDERLFYTVVSPDVGSTASLARPRLQPSFCSEMHRLEELVIAG